MFFAIIPFDEIMMMLNRSSFRIGFIIGFIIGYSIESIIRTYYNNTLLNNNNPLLSIIRNNNQEQIIYANESNAQSTLLHNIITNKIYTHDHNTNQSSPLHDDNVNESVNEEKIPNTNSINRVCNNVIRELMIKMSDNFPGGTARTKTTSKFHEDESDPFMTSIVPHPSFIWNYFIKDIFNASKVDNDIHHVYDDFIKEILLQCMKPTRLAISRKTLPFSQWNQIHKFLNISYQRWLYIHNNNNMNNNSHNIPRKLNIVVFGGSVTSGKDCYYHPINITTNNEHKFPYMTEDECSWSYRLERFLNNLLFGGSINSTMNDDNKDTDIVKVYKITIGGTDTDNGSMLWDLSLIPDDIPRNPDIIINAYSTNDVFRIISNLNDMTNHNITLFDERALDLKQRYIRLMLSSTTNNNNNDKQHYNYNPQHNCSNIDDSKLNNNKRTTKPLLLFYDDYIGNKEKYILKTWQLNKIIHILSNYYGIGYISYVDAVRDIVYANTNESWFSPPSWPNVNIHPGQGMHISSVWIIAYNLLDYITSYCSGIVASNCIKWNNNDDSSSSSITKLINEINNNHTMNDSAYRYRDVPQKKRPSALPPGLEWNLTLDTISIIWKNVEVEEDKMTSDLITACQTRHNDDIHNNMTSSPISASNNKPCYFSCICNVYITKGKVLEEIMNQSIIYNDGWKASYDNYKLGYVPPIVSSGSRIKQPKVIMMFTNVTQIVQTINVMTMHSYGKLWLNSAIEITSTIFHNSHNNSNTESTSMSSANSSNISLHDTIHNYYNNTTTTTTKLLLHGYHKMMTSEIHNHKMIMINQANIGDDIKIQFQLMSGTRFKITGIALCDH